MCRGHSLSKFVRQMGKWPLSAWHEIAFSWDIRKFEFTPIQKADVLKKSPDKEQTYRQNKQFEMEKIDKRS
jgi:hypothetical protein